MLTYTQTPDAHLDKEIAMFSPPDYVVGADNKEECADVDSRYVSNSLRLRLFFPFSGSYLFMVG